MRDRKTMSPGEVCRELGVTNKTLSRWVERGLLKPSLTTIGGHARYNRRAVEAFKKARSAGDQDQTEQIENHDLDSNEAPTSTKISIPTSTEPRERPGFVTLSAIERLRVQAEKGAIAQGQLIALHDQAVRQWLGVERGALFAYLWRYRLPTVAAAICTSVTQLRRVCEQHDIPLPPRSYWQTRMEPGDGTPSGIQPAARRK